MGSNRSKKIPKTEMLPSQSIIKPNAKFEFRNITAKQVYDLIDKLKNGKASGINLIPNKVLKLAALHISTSLAAIFSKYVLHESFQMTERHVSLCLFGRHECGNYRPITISSSLARFFEKITYNQSLDHS